MANKVAKQLVRQIKLIQLQSFPLDTIKGSRKPGHGGVSLSLHMFLSRAEKISSICGRVVHAYGNLIRSRPCRPIGHLFRRPRQVRWRLTEVSFVATDIHPTWSVTGDPRHQTQIHVKWAELISCLRWEHTSHAVHAIKVETCASQIIRTAAA